MRTETMRLLKYIALSPFFLYGSLAFSQFHTVGSAILLGDSCIQLTNAFTNQAGAAWNTQKIDLGRSFEMKFEVYLGCSDGGADGEYFVLQNVDTFQLGSGGGQMGYAIDNFTPGITPSLGVEFDTWDNGDLGDLVSDHTAIMKDGLANHLSGDNLAGPVAAIAGGLNIEDCNFHDVDIVWRADIHTIKEYFDCDLRLSYTGDIVADIFGGDPLVYFGFTAGTGAAVNLQKVCYDYIRYFDPEPDVSVTCGDSVQLEPSPDFDGYAWNPSYAMDDPAYADAFVWPGTDTAYTLEISGACGVAFYDTVSVTVASLPGNTIDTTICDGGTLTLDLSAEGTAFSWYDGTASSTHNFTTAGTYWVDVTNGLCTHRDSILLAYSFPVSIDIGADTSVCNDFQLDAGAGFSSYAWNDGSAGEFITVTSAGSYFVTVTDTAGCTASDTIQILNIFAPPPLNFPDSVFFCAGNVVTLDAGSGYASYLWFDGSTGQTNVISAPGAYWITVANAQGCETTDTVLVPELWPKPAVDFGPDTSICIGDILVLDADNGADATYLWQDGSAGTTYLVEEAGTYSVDVTNTYGCHGQDEINVTENCGYVLYMPNAFSPNGDGLNDVFRPTVLGQISNYDIRIFDRWGEMVFESQDYAQGWDGSFKNVPVEVGQYIYTATFTDAKQQVQQIGGTLILLR